MDFEVTKELFCYSFHPMSLLDLPKRRFPRRPGVKNNFLIYDTKPKTCAKLFFKLLKTKHIFFI
jgi:hypothetical protein